MFAQDSRLERRFGFLCPQRISDVPNNLRETRASTISNDRTGERIRYISDVMKNCQKNQLFFAPYNSG